MSYICHSGGCPGADMEWETVGREYGVKTIAYSFASHVQYGEHPYVLSDNELIEGYSRVQIAARSLHRPIEHLPKYIKYLLSRNWFQVKNAESVFAIGQFQNKKRTIVDGGTGWAVQMAIDEGKPVYVFDQTISDWFWYNKDEEKFEICEQIPQLTENFAGIGTRNLQQNGKDAIKHIYQCTCEPPS